MNWIQLITTFQVLGGCGRVWVKGHEEFLVPEEVWVTVCWTLQTERPEGNHGYTRFPLIFLLLLLLRMERWNKIVKALWVDRDVTSMCSCAKKLPAWGAWYWTRAPVFTWEPGEEQGHDQTLCPFRESEVTGHPQHGLLWPLHCPNPAYQALQCGHWTPCGCHSFHTSCLSASH